MVDHEIATLGVGRSEVLSSSSSNGVEREREESEFKQRMRRHAAELEVKLEEEEEKYGKHESLVRKIKNNVVKLIENLDDDDGDKLKRIQLRILEEFTEILESNEKQKQQLLLFDDQELLRKKANKLIRICDKLLYSKNIEAKRKRGEPTELDHLNRNRKFRILRVSCAEEDSSSLRCHTNAPLPYPLNTTPPLNQPPPPPANTTIRLGDRRHRRRQRITNATNAKAKRKTRQKQLDSTSTTSTDDSLSHPFSLPPLNQPPPTPTPTPIVIGDTTIRFGDYRQA